MDPKLMRLRIFFEPHGYLFLVILKNTEFNFMNMV